MTWRVENQKLFLGLLAGLIALAWLGLVIWGQSPYGRYLDHGGLARLGAGDAGLLGFFVAGWTLMVFAMMLPTSLPLMALFRAMTRERTDGRILITLLIAGYVGVWAWFGVVVHLADWGLHEVVEGSGWLGRNYWVVGAAVLAAAGGYQFSRLKYQCLDKCRSPMSFIMGRWTGRNDKLQALRLGLHHGVFCVGCCWPLMLLMFAVGSGNVGWMLGLGALMAAEKNFSWGRRIGKPLGAVLLAAGVGVVIFNYVGGW